MLCPNDNTEMHPVTIQSHYGGPIFLDQCSECGGIWFDESELYRAKQGEAGKVESLDSEILWTSSTFKNPIHICPKDQARLSRFSDKYFPQGIIVEGCPKCNGFWLNRGEFTKFQNARQELLRPKEMSSEDVELQEKVKQMVAQHQAGDTNDVLGRLGRFLSTPLEEKAGLPEETAQRSPEEENRLSLVLNIIMTLFRLFIFRF